MPSGIPLVEFIYTGCPTSIEVAAFLKELLELGWVSWFEGALVQGPILYPCNHRAQDRVCSLGLVPIISGHAGNPWTVPYWVQDVQVTPLWLSGAYWAFKGGLLHCLHNYCSDLVLCVCEVLGTHLGQDTLGKASLSMLVFPAL